MRTAICLFMLVLLFSSGCEEPERPKTKTTNSNYTVDVLFTDAEGFTVKRFSDSGRDHYYVTAQLARTETVQGGKARYLESISTSQK